MNYNILLVGYGNIGKRYLEGILKSQLNITVLIIDNNIDEEFEDKFKDLKNKNLHFSNSYKKFKKLDINLLINTTYATGRLDLIKSYCNYFNVKNLILEKVVENNLENIKEFKKLKLDNCWVNTFLRTLDVFKEIKNKSNGKIKMKVSGGNWGLLCNTIHYIDLLAFISESSPEKILKQDFHGKFIRAKRKGFLEIYGSFQILYKDESILDLECIDSDQELKIEYERGSYKYNYNLISGVFENNNQSRIIKVPYQSDMTTDLINNILIHQKCELTNLEDSLKFHEFFLKFIIDFKNHIDNLKSTSINIT
ncbi:MAG: hypothetical protein CMJ05_10770 [Pelagibacterales bacterium]|nr:hypothetical protein [Pelagibacterales bacterium]|tara:strand:+ start:2435 stop:3361 length:927 start_codon:yes stop_codon:yes gene_type:complete